MTRFSRILAAALAVVSLVLAAGCEQRPTGYDPNPNSPEGVPTAAAQLLAYRNAGLRVLARDYQSANIDSAESFAQAFPGPTTMPLLLLLDGTPANTFELYRINGGGKFERTADYPLQSIFKYVNAGYESFFSTDPSPGTYAPPSYLARGLVNGVASHQSPLSNEGQLSITYRGPDGGRLVVREGSYCAGVPDCIPTGPDAGTASFSDRPARLVEAEGGAWLVVAEGGDVNWEAKGTGMDGATLSGFTAAFTRVGK